MARQALDVAEFAADTFGIDNTPSIDAEEIDFAKNSPAVDWPRRSRVAQKPRQQRRPDAQQVWLWEATGPDEHQNQAQ